MAKKLSRKKFIKSKGGTCDNWYWSWSFINDLQKEIIFGVWEDNQDEIVRDKIKIFSEKWKYSKGKKQSGYKQSRKHIRLIEEEGYTLKTFLMKNSDGIGNGPRKIKNFEPKLTGKKLMKEDGAWFAVNYDHNVPSIPEELDTSIVYTEGVSTKIYVNSFERNRNARQKCLEHHGYKCKGCRFDFEKKYGSIGEKFIHVHHLIPIHSIKEEYQIDPIKDLVPICPNCHAIVHRKNLPLTMDELRVLITNCKEN